MGRVIEVPTRVFLSIVVLLAALVGVHLYDALKPTYVPTSTLADKGIKSVVIIECKDKRVGVTAGFLVSNHGHIITVAHGLTKCEGKKEKNITIRFWENPQVEHRAKLLKIDEQKDVAILQVPTTPKDIEPLDIDMEPQPQGARVVAIGHPETFYWSVSDGVVSADRYWNNPFRHYIQTTAPIQHGNSGGPVLNDKGKVIGIVSFFMDSTFNFLIPMDTVAQVAQGIHF